MTLTATPVHSAAPWNMLYDPTAPACSALIIHPSLATRMQIVRVEQKDSIQRKCLAQIRLPHGCRDSCTCTAVYLCFFPVSTAPPFVALSDDAAAAVMIKEHKTTMPEPIENELVRFLCAHAPHRPDKKQLQGSIVVELMSLADSGPASEQVVPVGESKHRNIDARRVLVRVNLDSHTFKLLDGIRVELLCEQTHGQGHCPHPPGFHDAPVRKPS